MRITCISDTHGFHRELELPGGDVLVHAGDIGFLSKRAEDLYDFNSWLAEQPYKIRVVIAGNHDFMLEYSTNLSSLLSNATLLLNRGFNSPMLKVWGSPITPLEGAAFGLANESDRRRVYESIPRNLDLLVTHSPPFGILDIEQGSDTHVGCPVLAEIVAERKPRLHVFGHVHGSHGMLTIGPTIYVNASQYLTEGNDQPQPITIELPARSKKANLKK